LVLEEPQETDRIVSAGAVAVALPEREYLLASRYGMEVDYASTPWYRGFSVSLRSNRSWC